MKMGKSITIMVPAYNEEKNLARAIERFDEVVKMMFDDYEFIIFDDCSSDRTGEIANGLAKKNKRVRVVRNKQNMGIGYNYREGIKLSQKDYYMFIGSDGDALDSSVKNVLSHIGKADIIIPYIGNQKKRPLYRRIISEGFTKLLNTLFNLKIRYYNGIVVHKTKTLKKMKMSTNSPAYQAEILVKLLKKGYSYKEVPFFIRVSKRTSIFRIKNLIGVFLTILRLFFEINTQFIKNKKRY